MSLQLNIRLGGNNSKVKTERERESMKGRKGERRREGWWEEGTCAWTERKKYKREIEREEEGLGEREKA